MPAWGSITLSSALSAILTALILGIWQPWAGAYSKEKGKNLARREDLIGILNEVKAVTVAQKGIETTLAGDLWSRQALWKEKRKLYGDMISIVHRFIKPIQTINSALEIIRADNTTDDALQCAERVLSEQIVLFNELDARMLRIASLCKIFLDNDISDQILDAWYKNNLSREGLTKGMVDERFQALIHLNARLVKAAKAEFGLNNAAT